MKQAKPAGVKKRGASTRAPAAPASAAAAAKEPRGARRRRETRSRLLGAALKLMSARGVDGVAVNEITEEADVGFGSFYNHFPSKEAIHAALIEHVFGAYADALDRALSGVTDPAEILAASIRHTLYRARQDHTWARLLLREGLSVRMLTQGLGARLLRDIRRGIDAGRFSVDDPLMAFVMLGGSTLAAITVEADYGEDGAAGLTPELRRTLGLTGTDLPERAATAMLRVLGVAPAEARRVARRQLARLEVPTFETP